MSFSFPSPPCSEHSHSSSLFEPFCFTPPRQQHSPASSIGPLSDSVDASSWATLQDAMGDLFANLLKEKQELERSNRAWEDRCREVEAENSALRAQAAQHSIWSPWACSHTAPLSAPPSPPGSATLLSSSPGKVASAPLQVSGSSKPSCAPRIDPTKPMSKQSPPPCNSHYLVGYCDVPHCKWGHAYELTAAQVDEIRRGARFHICNALKNGLECEDSACPYGHFCPRGSACGRSNCVFNDEQHRHPATVPNRKKRA